MATTTNHDAASTKMLFLNHASVLLRKGTDYLLTDPWYEKPAFGSWLPNPPLAVHPAMLAALGPQLRILISHGHDDHCDDKFLSLFETTTPVFSANYDSPSVKRRLAQLGMTEFTSVGRDGVTAGPFTIKSYINRDVSLDDAVYTIETSDAFVVHANDNWVALPPDIRAAIHADLKRRGHARALYMSQTNSASGHPLTYIDFSREERREMLLKKVLAMVRVGLENASTLGIHRFLSYAGFTSVFVKGHPEYFEDALYPDAEFLRRNLTNAPTDVEILSMSPGDEFDFSAIHPNFLSSGTTIERMRLATARYYERYDVVSENDSYAPASGHARATVDKGLDVFLEHFNAFVVDKVQRSGFESSILGKVLQIDVVDLALQRALKFGTGIVEAGSYNKKLIVESAHLARVLDGRSWFENLYTGYIAQIARRPVAVYNRDIVVYMVMFSYYYRNRVLPTLKDASRAPSSGA